MPGFPAPGPTFRSWLREGARPLRAAVGRGAARRIDSAPPLPAAPPRAGPLPVPRAAVRGLAAGAAPPAAGARGGGAAVPRGGGGCIHRGAPPHWLRRRAGLHVTSGAVLAAALAQPVGAGGAGRAGRWRRDGGAAVAAMG